MLDEHSLGNGKASDLTPMDMLPRATREERGFLHQSFAQAASGDAPLDLDRLETFARTGTFPKFLQEDELRDMVKGACDKHGSRWRDFHTDPAEGKVIDATLVRDMVSQPVALSAVSPCGRRLATEFFERLTLCIAFALRQCNPHCRGTTLQACCADWDERAARNVGNSMPRGPPRRAAPAFAPSLATGDLFAWQAAHVHVLGKRESDLFGRCFLHLCELEGRIGKSALIGHMVRMMNALVVEGDGRSTLCAVAQRCEMHGHGPHVVMVDDGRAAGLCVLETLKDGVFQSTRRRPIQVDVSRPHIVVTTNW